MKIEKPSFYKRLTWRILGSVRFCRYISFYVPYFFPSTSGIYHSLLYMKIYKLEAKLGSLYAKRMLLRNQVYGEPL